MQSFFIGYFLKDGSKKRAPTLTEMNYLIKNEVSPTLKMYTTGGSIKKLGVFNGVFVLNIEYKVDKDGIIKDLLETPDDDGHYYIGKWGWYAKTVSVTKKTQMKKTPLRKSPTNKSANKKCPNGSRRNKTNGQCVKY